MAKSTQRAMDKGNPTVPGTLDQKRFPSAGSGNCFAGCLILPTNSMYGMRPRRAA